MTAEYAGRWLDRVESLSRDALPAAVFRYVVEGARDEITVAEAESAWRAYRIAPHVLRDVRQVQTSVRLLGSDFALPVGIAPMALQRAADPDGEVAMARAAAAAGVPLVLSSLAGSTFADVAATGAAWWLQLYLGADRSASLPLLEAAVAAGARAVVLTVDAPVLGTRYPAPGTPGVWEAADPAWVGVNHPRPTGTTPDERPKAMDLRPADVGWLAEATGLPVGVKGVLRADDAAECVAAGATAVWVSNHGGRQLDQAVAAATRVAEIRDAVGDDAQVYVDGGVRSGLHVLVALALGADAAFVGRPMFHALAAGGTDGVTRALAELTDELTEAMRLSGTPATAAARGILSPDWGFGHPRTPSTPPNGV